MLRVIYADRVKRDRWEWWKVLLTGDDELDNPVVTGADVEGMNDDDRLAAGSVVITPVGKYVAYEDEVFTLRG